MGLGLNVDLVASALLEGQRAMEFAVGRGSLPTARYAGREAQKVASAIGFGGESGPRCSGKQTRPPLAALLDPNATLPRSTWLAPATGAALFRVPHLALECWGLVRACTAEARDAWTFARQPHNLWIPCLGIYLTLR